MFKLILIVGALVVTPLSVGLRAEEAAVGKDFRTRGVLGGWGHSWRPIFGQTRSDIDFLAFQPRMGWFLFDRLEAYGEGTLFVYEHPQTAASAGVSVGGRYYLTGDGGWIPYAHGGAGLIWTSLDVPEIDRAFNFQLIMGVGVRQNRPRGPCLVVEFRNHHISNAGTAGKNMGINAATLLAGVEWVLRPQ